MFKLRLDLRSKGYIGHDFSFFPIVISSHIIYVTTVVAFLEGQQKILKMAYLVPLDVRPKG